MVGILLLTHGDLGIQFINTARLIGISSEDSLMALSINPSDSPDAIRDRVSKAIKSVNSGAGVLILTDLFGGTPTNISLTFMEEGKVEVVTGLNLPMILKAINSRSDYDLVDLARMASDAGKDSIYLAAELLRKRRLKKQSGGK
jgi:mannose PTS system EIIA component